MVEPSRIDKKPVLAKPIKQFSTTVPLSEVVSRGIRFEASSFNLEARRAVQAMRAARLKLVPLYGALGLANFVSKPLRPPRVYVAPDRGVGFLSSSDIISMRPEVENYVSCKLTKNMDQLLIREWDVLISRSGTVGNVGLAYGYFVGKALSEHALRLRATKPEDAGFVSAFLRSRYGRVQLVQAAYGSVVQHIEPEHLSHVLIPETANRHEVGSAVMRTAKLREKANKLIDQADSLLHEALGLENLSLPKIAGPAINRIRLSKVAGRFDASYHDRAVFGAELKLKRIGVEITSLNDRRVTREIRPITKFRKRVYVQSGGIPMLSSKQLMQIDPVDVKRLAKGAHTKDLPEIALKHNMVTVSCSGTIGRVQIAPAYMEGWTANQHATRILAADGMNPGFLYAWLASDYGQKLTKRFSYGSVILEIDKEMIGAIPIPLPPAKVRDKIGDLVLQANDLRDQAWTLERQAIEQCESAINGSMPTALRWT